MSPRFKAGFSLMGAVIFSIGLVSVLMSDLDLPQTSAQEVRAYGYKVDLIPDQLTLTGDVATASNTMGQCPEPWLSGTPAGSIILGVNPTSCDPVDWNGGSATAKVFLQNIDSSTVVVIKLSWPNQDGKGLRSTSRDQKGSIALDGQLVWAKRTNQSGPSGFYYAAEHEPILTTIVLTRSITHTLSINVPAHTAWDLSQIELIAYPSPPIIKGIGYSPYRDCQYPGGMSLPSVQNIKEDLLNLSQTSNAIRTYAARGVNGQIPALANAIGLPIFAGAWLDKPKQSEVEDNAEIQALIELANHNNLAGAIVGNEYYLRHRSSEAIQYLRQRIMQVKNGIQDKTLPLMTAEIESLMFNWESDSSTTIVGINALYKPILDQVDIVLVHIYPFWTNLSIDGAAEYTINRYKAIQALIAQQYPGQNKRVIIGETGWPSVGGAQGAAIPSIQNQRRYQIEFMRLAEQQNVEYMYFDAFDELWKIEEPGHVGQNWGYSYTDRTAKHNFYGVLIAAEQLPSLAATDALSPSAGSHVLYLPLLSKYIQTFPVYDEWPLGPGFFAPSGSMGDINNIGLYECDRSDPHSGEMAIRASFSPTGTLGWGGVYWQYPENNWGKIDGGINLSGASQLTFWAKGKIGNEKVRFFVGGIGIKGDPYPDSMRPAVSTGFVQLSQQWQRYTIDLRGKDLTRVVGGFGWATDKCANPSPITFYLDDILFEYDPSPPPPAPPISVFPVYTDAAAQSNHYAPSTWMGDAVIPGRVSLTECWQSNPHSGQTSIRIAYTQVITPAWAGMYWVDPAGNRGDLPGGFDLRVVDRLTFWARSDTPNASVTFLIGGVGYPEGKDCLKPLELYSDSVCPKIEVPKALSSTWAKYTIDLHLYARNMQRVVGGFGWVSEASVTFYLDDIVYEFD